MATVLGVMNTAAAAGTTTNWQTPGYIRGNVRVMQDYYVAAGTEATGTVIKMHPPLDVGSVIIGHLLTASAATSSLTVSVGDLNSATRYVSASTSPATAGSYWYSRATSTGPYIIGTTDTSTTDTDRQIILTTGGATLASGTVLQLQTLYTID